MCYRGQCRWGLRWQEVSRECRGRDVTTWSVQHGSSEGGNAVWVAVVVTSGGIGNSGMVTTWSFHQSVVGDKAAVLYSLVV